MNSGMYTSLWVPAGYLVTFFVRLVHRPGGIHRLRLTRDVQTHLVAALILGPVQGQVGRREQLEQVMAVLAELGHPDRDRDADLRVSGSHAQRVGAAAQPLGDPAGAVAVGAGQQDGELLPAEPAYHVRLTDLLAQLG